MILYIFRQEISIAVLVVRVSCFAISVQECLLYARCLILQFRYDEFYSITALSLAVLVSNAVRNLFLQVSILQFLTQTS